MLANNDCSQVSKRKRRPAGTPDLQHRVPKGPKPADAQAAAQCSLEAAQEGNAARGEEEAGVRLPRAELPAPRPLPRSWRFGGDQEHFRRKHSDHKQWVCERCSKGYAVQSDYKAHLKPVAPKAILVTVASFSRVESFIEHQDACQTSRSRPESQQYGRLACREQLQAPILHLSIGSSDTGTEKEPTHAKTGARASRLKEEALAQLRLAMAEKAYAEEARRQAERQMELAKHELPGQQNQATSAS
ncbi:hypothetical protein F3Y22_tig00110610pilonHSYRG00024 [Hibiscus syriacus]|uniref:BIRD-IDD transcription factor third C2HC zinc finger domain-containing protein n=1 Tax=Hibiscus syriacus TaxID=106335 RepID=A0A6A3A2Y5_HIBSY|nr:hypothetical protein F3Y22_tig00110610pilonHSYRG00024 [Hibiscus syriacus]